MVVIWKIISLFHENIINISSSFRVSPVFMPGNDHGDRHRFLLTKLGTRLLRSKRSKQTVVTAIGL